MPRIPDTTDREHQTHPSRGYSTAMAKQASAATGMATFQKPPPRGTWSDEVVQSYDAYWDSSVMQVVQEHDVAKVVRYFDTLELEGRIYEELMVTPLTTTDDAGRVSSNPLIASLARVINTSIRLANEIGASPMARLKLGLTKLDGQLALAELERRLTGTPAGDMLDVARREVRLEEDIEDAEVVEDVIGKW